jgi:hypothetical protein
VCHVAHVWFLSRAIPALSASCGLCLLSVKACSACLMAALPCAGVTRAEAQNCKTRLGSQSPCMLVAHYVELVMIMCLCRC